MAETIFLVEGKCEKEFINDLKKMKNIPAKIKLYNPLKSFYKILRSYHQDDTLYFVFDTDILNSTTIKIFERNLSILKGFKNKFLIMQIENFEDELVYSCSKLNKKLDLFQLFDTNSENEFKENFINQSNRLEKLDSKGFDISKLWCQETPSILSQYKIERKQGTHFQ